MNRAKNSAKKSLSAYRRIVIKIGSSLLVDRVSGLRQEWLTSLCQDLAWLRAQQTEVLLVSSGAIALGRSLMKCDKKRLKLAESQAYAALGQIELSSAYSKSLAALGLRTGQILLSWGDTEERSRYLNARATIETLLSLNSIPLINENDTVATQEIRYGDNDRLAARVATMMRADLLILLSDIDGFYSAPPQSDRAAQFLPYIAQITPEIEKMAGGAASILSRGGMKTKLEAGKIANVAGTAMIISSGLRLSPLSAIEKGARHSYFAPSAKPTNAWKSWISGQLAPRGSLIIDKGALLALKSGKSLLAAGVKECQGDFSCGDIVAIYSEEGYEVARGLMAYNKEDVKQMLEPKIEGSKITGHLLIHRNDLVLAC